MSHTRRRHPPHREPPRDPWAAHLFGTLWELSEPSGMLCPAPATHSFKVYTRDVIRFGKLRSIDRTGVQNFIHAADGGVYRVAFASQTPAGRKWVRLHVARCRCPKLELPGGARRLQVMAWMLALKPGDVPAEELAWEEPLLPGE